MTDPDESDDQEPDDREPEPTIDEILEAARRGEHIPAPEHVGPVIGSRRIVKEKLPAGLPELNRQVWRCSCGLLATGWHAGHELDAVEQVEIGKIGTEYYERLADAAHASRLDKWIEWGPDQWRALVEFPNYEMNGWSREVRRRAHTLKNGTVRPPREVKARKSSVTLSRDGVVKSRGIEKLWKLTFPEYVIDPNSWDTKKLRHDNIPAELGRVIEIRR